MEEEEMFKRMSPEIQKYLKARKEGYAGVNKYGQLVDRREYPDAVPMQENVLMGIPVPKPLPNN